MKNFKTYYKRNLPHYQPIDHTYFVTYRLSGSLPLEVIKKLRNEREKQLKDIAGISDKSIQQEKYKKMQSVYFGKFDKLLDASDYGPTWLKQKEIAQIVKDVIHFYDKKKYDLICYTIMSNHSNCRSRFISTRKSKCARHECRATISNCYRYSSFNKRLNSQRVQQNS